MTTISIYDNNIVKGKYQIEVLDKTQLVGAGIIKDKNCRDLNCYWATKKAIEKLRSSYNCVSERIKE